MSKPVRIAELKANLSAFLRRVKRGETVTVMDRDTPVAQLVPIETARPPVRMRRARGRLADLTLPSPLRTRSDIVSLLLEERGER
ncbi:MAG TPA: type II toxin-antitoxin system prevent-host-death family antitoxin [Thermoanaerobaculia bacterium]|nr:type II toxin-antitoxin system prevent-host-death family antitoxin [Thermoanaerobaculia bacterium]